MPIATIDYKSKTFHLEVPVEFQDSFFSDRHKIVDVTKRYIQRHKGQSDGTLTPLHGGVLLWGASTVEENFLIDSLIAAQRPKVVVEIGIYRGQSSVTMNRAIAKYCPEAQYFGFDISPAAVEITQELLSREEFAHQWKIAEQPFEGVLPGNVRPDFVFVDGDHSFDGAARDLVSCYNLMESGIITMHDVGSPTWGFTKQDPGYLFGRVLPTVAGRDDVFSFLDSMCRDLTMRMLFPNGAAKHHYTTSESEAQSIGAMTMKDTVDGWGGIGIWEKKTTDHQIKLTDVMALKPKVVGDHAKIPKKSIFSRSLRKAAELIP